MIPEEDEQEYALSLVTLCNSVLESVIAVFETYGIDLPERRYVVAGQEAHDCEQVVVSFRQLYLGPPGDQAQTAQRCTAPRSTFLNVSIVRALPMPGRTGAPSAQSLQAATERQLVDAYMLMKAGTEAADQWGLGTIADVSVGEPGGALQAITLNLALAVP